MSGRCPPPALPEAIPAWRDGVTVTHPCEIIPLTERQYHTFWSYVAVAGPEQCWPWQRARDLGYGKWGVGGIKLWAHRVSYELLVGPIPPGLTLDHLCRVRECVNPRHLEPVTPALNVLRGDGMAARNARKTACVRGHPFDEENTYVAPDGTARPGERACRTCKTDWMRRRRAEQRGMA